ncbi:MAG TPA: hypothetical protein ENN88_03660, partial [Candidatus Coatesbacteria bacterium]|nr:hypothetical protein [Candidatus Coatesbacteria bacterium]
MAFFDFLDGLELCGDCWLLAERGALRRSLVRELAARPAAGPGVIALTLEQAARRLVQGAPEPFLFLERGEPVLLAWLLLERHSQALPYFRRFVEEGRRAVRGVAAPVAEALRHLAALSRPPSSGKGRVGDLARLLGFRREWLAARSAGEMADLYRRTAELLRSGALEPPESAVLCFPSFLGPVELEFLRALAGRTRLRVVHEDDEQRVFAAVSSTAFSAPTARGLADFAETTCGEPPADERLALVSWLYDDGEKPVPPVGIHPWSAVDRADEVVRVVR